MQPSLLAVTAALIALNSARASFPDDAPIVSRERLWIDTVRRGNLTRRVAAYGSVKRAEAIVEVNAAAVQGIMVGQPALVDVHSELLHGKVAGISAGPGGAYTVTVALLDSPAGLADDSPAAVSIQTEQLKDVLLIAGDRRLAPGRTLSLFKLEPDSDYATRVVVRIGKATNRLAEIGSGLVEGDRVITTLVDVPESTGRIRLN